MKAGGVHYHYLFAYHSILPFLNFTLTPASPVETEIQVPPGGKQRTPLFAQLADYDADKDILDKTASVRQFHIDRNFLPSDYETGKIHACPQIG